MEDLEEDFITCNEWWQKGCYDPETEKDLWEAEMKKKVKEMEEQDMKNAELQEELEEDFIYSIRKESIDD